MGDWQSTGGPVSVSAEVGRDVWERRYRTQQRTLARLRVERDTLLKAGEAMAKAGEAVHDGAPDGAWERLSVALDGWEDAVQGREAA
jgi:hypothetical protein